MVKREVRLLKAIAGDPKPLILFAVLKCIVEGMEINRHCKKCGKKEVTEIMKKYQLCKKHYDEMIVTTFQRDAECGV